jgi:hypothetical protein
MASTPDPGRPISASPGDEDALKEEEPSAQDETPKKPGLLKRAWIVAGLDPPTIIFMAKGGLPPIISLAALTSTSFSAIYTTLGYLVAISSLLGFAVLPRAKFVQAMTLNVVSFGSVRPLDSLTVSAFHLHWSCRHPASMPSGHIC